MTATVHSRIDGEIAVFTIEHPPINALAQPVRAALLAAIEAADANPAVKAIVIHAAGKLFVGGADIREFDAPPKAPILNDTLLRLESCAKPVVAALHGMALGGGFEVALASHYRIAAKDTKLGLPEVKLGLLPGSGAPVRLPRIVGPKLALEMMLSGEPIAATKAQELGILDRLADGDVLAAALAFARELVASGQGPRRLCDRELEAQGADAAYFAEQRVQVTKKQRGLDSPPRIVDCVEAAVTQPFAAALARSRVLFEECRTSTSSRALRHLFFAERGSKVAGEPCRVERVCVLGAGTMGSGIAISLATAGYAVSLVDTKPEAVAAGMQRVKDTIEGSVQKGRMSAEAGAAAIGRVTGSSDFAVAANAELVIEAVFESMAVKQEVFGRLDAICKPGAVLATNTSTLDVDRIAAATKRPADVVGMHFFSPANIMRLVEIVRGGASSAGALATALAVTKRMGKLGIVVGNCFGFVGNRMLYGYGRESQLMVLEGAGPMRIDRVLKSFGMAMGPNAVGDLAGLDIGYRVRRERTDLPPDPRYFRVFDLLVEAGRLGQKTGKGTFLYPPGSREPVEDPEVDALIAAEAKRLGVTQRTFTDEEIVERCMLGLINEGAQILGEGIAASPGDIDAIWCNGYGYPRFRGGPMFYADTWGLGNVLAAIRRYAAAQGELYWTPAPLIVELAAKGQSFGDWQRARGGD